MKLKKILSTVLSFSMIFSAFSAIADDIDVPDNTESIIVNYEPADALVRFYNTEGNEISADALQLGSEYTYKASRYGYVSKSETFTAEAELSISLDSVPDITVYGKNSDNMSITDISLPKYASLKWKKDISYDKSSDPIVTENAIYIIANGTLQKLNPENGEADKTAELAAGQDYSWVSTICYGDGLIFVPIGVGQVQAFDADSLTSLWISEEAGGDIATPLTYNDGKLFFGTYSGDSGEACSYCMISTTDEDIDTPDEVKSISWKVNDKNGFYAAGAYVNNTVVVFGSESGCIYSADVNTGEIISSSDVNGAVRSSVSYSNGNIYFTTKDGYFYTAELSTSGVIDAVRSIELPAASTSTPAIYNGMVYIGSDKNSDEKYNYLMIDTSTMEIKASVETPGYAQEDALISTADNTVVVYTTYNAVPGGIYKITYTEENGEPTLAGEDFFVPENTGYCLSNITFDAKGTIYYKNDSGYLFAVENGENPDEALTSAKLNAQEALKNKFERFEKKDYSSGNYTEITNIYEDAQKKIEAAEAVSELNGLINKAYEDMLHVSCLSSSRVTAYISIEKFTIGQGYIKEPTELSMKKYTTASQFLNNVAKDIIAYSGTLTSDFYLSAVSDNNLKLSVPDYISDAVEITDERQVKGYLSEFDYTPTSGWVYTVNGELMDIPASDYIVKNGDVIRFQFSLAGYGTDIYSTNTIEGHEKLYDIADKDELTKQLAIVNGYTDFKKYMDIQKNKTAYNNAIETAKNPKATQRQVLSATDSLKNLTKPSSGTTSSPPSPSRPSSGNQSSKPSGTISSPVNTNTEQNVFTDISNHWAKDYIYKLYNKKIITGRTENTFDPDAELTRAECVALLSRIANANLSEYNGSDKFTDIPSDAWYNSAVGWAVANGISSGMSESEFAPSAPITREQFVTLTARFADFMNIELKETANEIIFTDAGDISDYAVEYITKIQRAGIISGKGENTFAPKDRTTRAETAKMLSYFVK